MLIKLVINNLKEQVKWKNKWFHEYKRIFDEKHYNKLIKDLNFWT